MHMHVPSMTAAMRMSSKKPIRLPIMTVMRMLLQSVAVLVASLGLLVASLGLLVASPGVLVARVVIVALPVE